MPKSKTPEEEIEQLKDELESIKGELLAIKKVLAHQLIGTLGLLRILKSDLGGALVSAIKKTKPPTNKSMNFRKGFRKFISDFIKEISKFR